MEKKKKRWKYAVLAIAVCILAAVLPMADRSFGGCREVQAAVRRVQTKRVKFKDGSGNYLLKKGSQWYLFNRKGKRLSGVQYLKIPSVKPLSTGFYMFDKKGKLIQKKAVYHINKQTIKGVTFQGYHYANSYGRFLSRAQGLKKFSKMKCAGRVFQGYYYQDRYGRLSNTAGVRYLPAKKLGKVKFKKGYYYFNKYGKLCTKSDFHRVDQTIGKTVFQGSYYFGDGNGRLRQKAGWVTVKKKKYYISGKGKDITDPLRPLKKQIQKMAGSYGGEWSVYVKDLKTGNVMNLNPVSMYPASTIKAFVMASTFDQINQKKLSYNSSVKKLLKDMITVSDNEACNQLVRYHSSKGEFVSGAGEINRYLKKYGYTSTECHHTLHPSDSAYTGDGSKNKSSARDCGVLLERIYKGTCVSEKYSEEMLKLLLGQTRRGKIPAGLPSGVKCANKTGENVSIEHDMAIVYGKKTDYVICVFSSGTSERTAIAGIKSISAKVYDYLN